MNSTAVVARKWMAWKYFLSLILQPCLRKKVKYPLFRYLIANVITMSLESIWYSGDELVSRELIADNLNLNGKVRTDGTTEDRHSELVSYQDTLLLGNSGHHDRRIATTFLSRRVQLTTILASGTFTQIVSFCTFVESYLYLLRGAIL
jgi:hypothetical protein